MMKYDLNVYIYIWISKRPAIKIIEDDYYCDPGTALYNQDKHL